MLNTEFIGKNDVYFIYQKKRKKENEQINNMTYDSNVQAFDQLTVIG